MSSKPQPAVAAPALEPNPFYMKVLEAELGHGSIQTSDRVLVVCGGNLDRVCLLAAGFKDVVISNLASHGGHDDYSPYTWRRENAESLSVGNESFDLVIVHSGLHHCYNPHQALGELCRVARKLVVAFEPYDTWFTRVGAKLGYGQQYEDLAVHGARGRGGGVANTEVPNYVYRFREAEVEKFARAFFPHARPVVRYYKALRINVGRFGKLRSGILRGSFKLAYPVIRGLARWIPSLNNNFCFTIQSPAPSRCHPWIRLVDGKPKIHKEYLEAKYGPMPE